MGKTIIAEMPMEPPPVIVTNQTNGVEASFGWPFDGKPNEELRKEGAIRLRGAYVLRHKGKPLRRHPLKPVRHTHQMEQQLAIKALIAIGERVVRLRSARLTEIPPTL